MIGQAGDTYYIGDPLLERVNTFVAIAGCNYGSAMCAHDFWRSKKCCDKNLGAWGGSQDDKPWPNDMSSFLRDLNSDPQREAKHMYVIATMNDEIIPSMIFSKFTPEFAGLNQTFIFSDPLYDHCGVRDLTVEL